MLSPHELELLTAHVDGELTRRQRREVNRLLDRSEEARALLRQLEDDSGLLRRLPTLQVKQDLSSSVLTRIGQRKQRPVPRLERSAPARLPAWLGFAAAAAVLILVGAVSFLVESTEGQPEQERVVRAEKSGKLPPRPDLNKREEPEEPGGAKDDADLTPPSDPPRVSDPPKAPPAVPDRIHPPTETAPERKGERTVLASGGNESVNKFERVELSLPTVWKLHELDRGDAAERLLGEVRRSAGVRVELPARDATRGFEWLRASLLERQVQLTFDPAVLPRLKKPLWKTDYAVFIDNLPPEDLVGALRSAGVADRLAGEKKAGEMRFDGALVVKDLARLDRKELSDLLGVDPVTTRPARQGRRKVNLLKELTEQTEGEVANALDGKGVPRPGARAEPQGYVTLLAGSRGKPVELKRFLDARRPAHPGTVQVFLVVRQVGG